MRFPIYKAALILGLLSTVSCTSEKKKEEAHEKSADAEKAFKAYPVTPLTEEGLEWITNESDPVFSSKRAKKGGTVNTYMDSFPLTLRNYGPDSNGSFRGAINGSMMELVVVHPNTGNVIPSLATHWALGKDKKTVYFKINPKARWSDGVKITSDDFLFGYEFYRSKHIVAPFTNRYMEDHIVEVRKHDEHTISVVGTKAKPQPDIFLDYSLGPKPRHFHKLDENWVRDFNWKIEPNTGAYQITKVEKGKKITFERKKDWWAKDLKYYQNRFNVDRVVMEVIRDNNVAWEHFKKGNLSYFGLMAEPEFWYDKSNSKEFKNGYIHKQMFYVDKPQPFWGIFLNQSDPMFKDQNVKLAFHHAINMDKVLKEVMRGDAARAVTVTTGYGEYSNYNIPVREYSVEKVKEYMEKSGWKRGPDGIWLKDGQRYSVTMTYGRPNHDNHLVVLKEEAKKAGVEINLNKMDGSASFKTMMDKKHQVAWQGWGSGFIPHYWGMWHTDNAFKINTTNITNTSDKKLDELIIKFRESISRDERTDLAKVIQAKIHEEGGVVPTFVTPWVRNAYWGWYMFPEVPATRMSDGFMPWYEKGYGGVSYGGLFWIDEDAKKEIEAARKSDKKLPAVEIVNTKYKK